MTSGIIAGTPVVASSQTSIDYSIPAGVKRITVLLKGLSTNGTADLLVQLGNGSVVTSGYNCACVAMSSSFAASSSTNGFLILAGSAALTQSGQMVLCLLDSTNNIWSSMLCMGRTDTAGGRIGGGDKTLTSALDRIRITTTNGTDKFDAGSVNIFYE